MRPFCCCTMRRASATSFGTHWSNNNASGAVRLGVLSSGTEGRSSQSGLSRSDAHRSSFTGIAARTQFAQLTPANVRRARHIFAGSPDRIDKEPSRRIQQPVGGIRRPARSFAFEAKTAKGGQGSVGTDCRPQRSRFKGNGEVHAAANRSVQVIRHHPPR
jgi:hypothetical protein